jgi:hypothetical protein
LTQFKDLPTKKMEEFDYTKALVESLLSPGLRHTHQAIMCFVEHYLLKEMEKMKKGGKVKEKDKKKYKDLKEALEALDEYNDTIIHLMNKAKVELEPINEDDDDDDDEHSEYQGNSGNQ